MIRDQSQRTQKALIETNLQLHHVGTDIHNIAGTTGTRIKAKLHNAPSFDLHAAPYRVYGTDLTQIHGPRPSLALKLIAGCGRNLCVWQTAKHFTF